MSSAAPSGAVVSAAKNALLGGFGQHPANMLIPQAYDVAWTDLHQPYNLTLSPGQVAALSGATNTATSIATATAAPSSINNFPSGRSNIGDRDFENPIVCTQKPLTAGSGGTILGANPKRTLLIVQNNSASGGATFWVAFGQTAVQNACVGLQPGQAMVLDASCPRDSVSILVTGAAGLTSGVVVEGAWTRPSPPASGPNPGMIAWGFGTLSEGRPTPEY